MKRVQLTEERRQELYARMNELKKQYPYLTWGKIYERLGLSNGAYIRAI